MIILYAISINLNCIDEVSPSESDHSTDDLDATNRKEEQFPNSTQESEEAESRILVI